jgi:hypothetical protein
MNNLQKALQYNAIFSGISGVAFILGYRTLGRIFAISYDNIFWMIGAALLFFAATIIYEIPRQRRLAVLWIITQDMLWVVGSAILLMTKPFGISDTGNALIATVALIVLGMGINQYQALRDKKATSTIDKSKI